MPLQGYSANLIRDFVRATMIPDVLVRMYNIGMGIQKFDVPTMVGSVVNVEAPSGIQLRALEKLSDIGVPPRLGLDGSGELVPGVFVVGGTEAGMELARDAAKHGEYATPIDERRPPVSQAMLARAEQGEYTIVEVDENAETQHIATRPRDYEGMTTEQRILARRNELRRTEGAKAVG